MCPISDRTRIYVHTYVYAYISNALPSYDIIARPQQKTALIYYPGNIHIDQS